MIVIVLSNEAEPLCAFCTSLWIMYQLLFIMCTLQCNEDSFIMLKHHIEQLWFWEKVFIKLFSSGHGIEPGNFKFYHFNTVAEHIVNFKSKESSAHQNKLSLFSSTLSSDWLVDPTLSSHWSKLSHVISDWQLLLWWLTETWAEF